ncbi:MAG: recombinase family protein [Blautia sp.]|nr:recombinase family protein [Blautia sp.]
MQSTQRQRDRILTKSVSRFARNTVDSLNAIRELKGLGIGVDFQKENRLTRDAVNDPKKKTDRANLFLIGGGMISTPRQSSVRKAL